VPNLYQRRRVLFQDLARKLPSGFIISRNPDHPFLLQGPDLLIGGQGKITAIFLPSAAERRNEQRLRARYALNRVALPAHTKCLLVVDGKDEVFSGLFPVFDEVFHWEERMTLLAVLNTDSKRTVPRETSIAAQKQFSNAIAVTELMQRIDRSGFEGDFPPVIKGRPRKEVDWIEGVEVAYMRGGRFNAAVATDLIIERANREIGLDAGIPYYHNTKPSIAVVPDWPIYPSDPLKVVRAAGFAGWSIMTQDELVNKVVTRINTRGWS
jgi:hypothetical protein